MTNSDIILDEWRSLELACEITASCGKNNGIYVVSPFNLDKYEELLLLRPIIWEKHRTKLDINERFNLGKELEKSLVEIFSDLTN